MTSCTRGPSWTDGGGWRVQLFSPGIVSCLRESQASWIWVQDDSQGGCLATRESEGQGEWLAETALPARAERGNGGFHPAPVLLRDRIEPSVFSIWNTGGSVSTAKLVEKGMQSYKKMWRRNTQAGLLLEELFYSPQLCSNRILMNQIACSGRARY